MKTLNAKLSRGAWESRAGDELRAIRRDVPIVLMSGFTEQESSDDSRGAISPGRFKNPFLRKSCSQRSATQWRDVFRALSTVPRTLEDSYATAVREAGSSLR